MRTVVCPGSFDPFTLGHLDVVKRAQQLADHVIVGVARNAGKSALFNAEQRVDFAQRTLQRAGLSAVEVRHVPGLLTEFCDEVGAKHIVKGLRNGADLDSELPMALMNRSISGVETLFILGEPSLSHIASSLVKDVARHGGEISNMVDVDVAHALYLALSEEQ